VPPEQLARCPQNLRTTTLFGWHPIRFPNLVVPPLSVWHLRFWLSGGRIPQLHRIDPAIGPPGEMISETILDMLRAPDSRTLQAFALFRGGRHRITSCIKNT
jgi:hypothetical protein